MTSTFKPQKWVEEKAPGEFMTSRIYRAIRKGDSHRVLSAIRKGDDVLLRDANNLTTYLHLVVIMSNSSTEDQFLPMVHMLSNYDVNPNEQDKRGRTPLELAINKDLKHIMVALIRVGTDLLDKDYKVLIQSMQSPYKGELLDMYDKYEPGLWGAVKKNNTGLVHMLVNSWCRINTAKNNKSLLYYAKLTRKSADIIQILEDFDCTIEFVHATLAGDETRMLKYLMDTRGTDPYIMDISYQENDSAPLIPRSLRDTAIDMGHTHILHLIPEAYEETSDNDCDYDTGISGHNLDDSDDDNNADQNRNNPQLSDEESISTPTNSEYSGSIANSIENSSIQGGSNSTNGRKQKYIVSNSDSRSSSISSRKKSSLTPSNHDGNFYYYKSYDDEETSQGMFHPDILLHQAQLSAREYRMNWDHANDRPIPLPRKKKKKKGIKINKQKINTEIEIIKSKMCVIS